MECSAQVRRDRLPVFSQAFQIRANRILRHLAGLLQGVTFRGKAGEGSTGDDVAAFRGWLRARLPMLEGDLPAR